MGSNSATRYRWRWWSGNDSSAVGSESFLRAWRDHRDSGALGSGSYSGTWCWGRHGSSYDRRTMGKVVGTGSRNGSGSGSGSWTICGEQVHAIQAYWRAGRSPEYGTAAAGVVPKRNAGNSE